MNDIRPVRWIQRFENFERAFLSLVESQKALLLEPDNRFIQDSLIQRYEYTIELAWKTMKDYLEELGFIDVTSPKSVIRQAFQERIIHDGTGWFAALEDRNRTSHAYEEAMANEVTQSITDNHITLFQELYTFLKEKRNAQ